VESSAGDYACHSGFRVNAPQCIDACPGSCRALEQAITAYITKGGQAAAKREVCANSWAFKCYVEDGHKQFCQSLIDRAAHLGWHLPGSPWELDQECQSLAAEEAPAEAAATAAERGTPTAVGEDAATQALVESSAGDYACHSGFRVNAPQCIDACPGSCRALEQAITAYITKGGQAAAKREVCANSWAFKCYVEDGHKQFCQSLIDRAAHLGWHLPGSPWELDQECQSLAAEEAPAEAAATAAERGTPTAVGEDAATQATISELHP